MLPAGTSASEAFGFSPGTISSATCPPPSTGLPWHRVQRHPRRAADGRGLRALGGNDPRARRAAATICARRRFRPRPPLRPGGQRPPLGAADLLSAAGNDALAAASAPTGSSAGPGSRSPRGRRGSDLLVGGSGADFFDFARRRPRRHHRLSRRHRPDPASTPPRSHAFDRPRRCRTGRLGDLLRSDRGDFTRYAPLRDFDLAAVIILPARARRLRFAMRYSLK